MLAIRPRKGRQVGNTLDRLCRRFKLNTGRSERADVLGHLGEVVDGFISVRVQIIQILIDRLNVRTLFQGVGQNSLDRPHLSLVLPKTIHDRVEGQRFENSTAGIDCLVGYIRERGNCHDVESAELFLDTVQCPTNAFHFDITELVCGRRCFVKVQGLIELSQRRTGLRNALFELFIVELHCDYAVFDFTQLKTPPSRHLPLCGS